MISYKTILYRHENKNEVRDHSSKGLTAIPKCAFMWLICVELSRSEERC